ncbi:MAG: YCF48-related protein [Melioribacteraceae bacterium]
MRTILIALLLCLVTLSYGQWNSQTSGVTTGLNDVHFEDANTGWVVGAGGTILKTINGGSSWSALTSGTANQINSVFFTSSTNGAVVGSGGFVSVTLDGGNTWFQQITGYTTDFSDIFYTDIMTAYIVGEAGKILKSTDGGLTWVSKPNGAAAADFFWSVWFTDSNTGWAVGGNLATSKSTILKTTDAGNSWVSQTSPTTDWLYSVSFSDSQKGWAAAPNGTIISTTDGGVNWLKQPSGELWEWFYSCYAADANNVWVGGGSGLIKNTKDGGTSWATQPSGVTGAIRSFYFIDANTGWAVGDGGTILKHSNSSLSLLTPNGGETWRAGSNQNITWSSSGIVNLKIEYSLDNGANWNTAVVSTPAATGHFTWAVPSAISSTQALLRISDASNSALNDQSNATFIIVNPSISVSSPNGGERWRVGTTQNITWISSDVANVKIEYSIDDRATWKTLIASTPAEAGAYPWVIPDEPTLQAVVKISDVVDNLIRDDSNAPFHIEKPTLHLTTPNGGENWKSGSIQNISWTSTIIANVSLYYSIDNGTTWTGIANNITATPGNYSWTIPDIESNQVLVKVVDFDDDKLSDQSDAIFSIFKPSITVTSPNGGEVWKGGSDYDINWNSSFVTNVRIEISHDDGVTWTQLANNLPAVPNTFSALLPSVNSNICLIRISDAVDNTIFDKSDARFAIYTPTITLTSPNGGEMWRGGSSQNITWASNNVTDVKLEFSADNGLTWSEIIANTPAVSGSYNGTVPIINTNQGLVRISDVADNKIVDQSDATFSIFLPSITLNSPNGGESWKVGSSQNISWLSHDVTNVKLDYSIDNGINWVEIINSTPANIGSYSWVVPNSITSQALVKVTDISDNSINDQSDSVFRIFNKSISVLTPNGGENWKVGSNQSISWISTNITNVSIEYSTDSGTNWTQIIANTTANINGTTNYFAWTVPNTVSTNCKVRITEVGEPSLFDISNSQFTIFLSTLTLTSPNGGEKWKAGSSQNITWLSENILNVKIEYTIDDGESWTIITSNTEASTGTFNWVVPDFRSSKVAIRVSDTEDDLVTDRSDAVFRILEPQINLLTPIGGENVRATSNYLVEWETTDVEKVEINFSSDGGTTWTQLVSAIETPVDAKYNLNWTTPNLSSNACLIRVADLNDASNYSVSNASFTLFQSSLQVLTPNGGEQIKVGSKYNITWTSTNVGKIDISYTTDGISARTIASNIDASLSTYEWNVPNLSSTNCKIIIQDIDFPTLIDRSDSPFSVIIPSLTLISPNGGENWKVGSLQNITWTSSNVTSIKLEYSINNGTTWKLIAANVLSNPSSFSWVVSNEVTTQALVRISDESNNSLIDQSNTTFSIYLPTLALTSPNGGESWRVGSSQNINWTSANVTNVKIEFSTDNGSSWNLIAENIPAASLSYVWVLPDAVTTYALVRITDSEDANLNDRSNGVFNIHKSTITLLSPNGGENWKVGSSKNITWVSNNVTNVKIEYSVNNGSSWKLVTDNISTSSSPSSYLWIIPNDVTTQALIKITAVDNADVNTSSNSAFTISISSLTLLSPNNGDVLQAEKYYNITWHSEGVSKVKIEFWNGTWNELANNVDAGLGAYNWLTSDVLGSYRIKISDVDAPSNYAESSVRIASLKIVSPNGGERLAWGVQTKIMWSDSDNNKSGKAIEVSSDNGQTWQLAGYTQDGTILTMIESGSVNWTPYGNPSVNYKVRIKDRYLANMTDECDGNFEVYKQPIALTQPNGGESFQAKDQIYIVFNTADNIARINLDYTTDNGNSWNSIVSNYDVTSTTPLGIKQYAWKAPRIYSTNFKIRVTDAANSQNSDLSDNTFAITERKIDIIYPTGNEIYSPGYRFSDSEYYPDDGPNQILVKAKIAPELLGISYFLPSVLNCFTPPTGRGATIVNGEVNFLIPIIECVQGSAVVDIWDGQYHTNYFDAEEVQVKPHPFEITSPNYLDNSRFIIAEKPFDIKWTLVDPEVKNVKIELKYQNSTYLIVDNHPASTGKYTWQVPKSLIGVNTAEIKISDANMPTYFSCVFGIGVYFSREIVIEEPTKVHEVWESGTTHRIKWTSLNVAKVKIEYNTTQAADLNWHEIAQINSATFPSFTGSIDWTVPNVKSSNVCSIRITDLDNPSTSDRASFSIKNYSLSLRLNESKFTINDTVAISWDSDNVQNVRVKYSLNQGVSWITIATVTNQYNDSGYCNWIIPNTPANNVGVRIEDANNPSVGTQTEFNLAIMSPVLQLISPAAGTRLTSEQSVRIDWNVLYLNLGEGTRYDLEFSIDSGNNWNPIGYFVFGGYGYKFNYMNWIVPSITTKEKKCLIRVKFSKSNIVVVQAQTEVTIEPIPQRIISSADWNTPLNFTEGAEPVLVLSNLSISLRSRYNDPAIRELIVRIHAENDADSIKQRYKLTTSWSSGSIENGGLQVRFAIPDGTLPSNAESYASSVKFQYIGEPHKLNGDVACIMSLVVVDDDSSNVLTRPITFTSVNSSPVISDNTGNELDYTIGTSPIKIASGLSISDDVNLRGKGTFEVVVSNNYVSGEDLIGSVAATAITTSFLVDQAKYKMTANYSAPTEVQKAVRNGLYYLVENGSKSLNKTKNLEMQYFDDYQAGSNILTKSVTVKAPVIVAPNLKPPEAVKIEHITGGNIKVSWVDRSGNVKGFIIYRTLTKVGKVSAAYTLLDEDIIGIVPAEQLEFVDKTTAEGFTYSYRIASYNESGLSDLSAQPPIVVNSVIKPPTNLAYKLIAYNTIQLNWEDNSEVEEGFVLEAKHDTSSTYKEVIKLNKNLTSFNVYNFIYNRNYRFRLKAFNSNTTSDESNVLEIKLQPTDAEELGFLPTEFALYQNYPNPFNPSTTINYHLPTASQVSIKVYDMLGREVVVLVNDYQNPGLYSIEMNSKYYNLVSGMYFYRIRAGVFSETKKMVLLK